MLEHPASQDLEDSDIFFRGVSVGRPRPSRAIPPHIACSIPVSPDAGKRITGGYGITLAWQRPRWRSLEYDMKELQSRTLRGALFRGEALVGAVEFLEVRNATYRAMDFDEFLLICDDHSQEMANISSKIVEALDSLMPGRNFLHPREAFVEFNTLILLPAGKAQRPMWPEVINKLILTEYERKNDFTAMIVQPLPLEYKGATVYDPCFQRRLRAMIKLYEQTLGVDLLNADNPSQVVMGRLF